MSSLLRRLRAVWYDLRSSETDALRRYWTKRALGHGERSVLNLGHSEAEAAAVTAMQRKELFPLLRSQLRGDERIILDYGCGSGRFTVDLANIVRGRAIGVDPTEPLIEIAPKAATVEYHLLQTTKVPVPDASVDVVWICLVLGCIPDDQLQSSIEELRRVLRTTGLVFLVENTAERPNRPYFFFRPVDAYRELFSWAALKPIGDYDDLGERISVLAGRVR